MKTLNKTASKTFRNLVKMAEENDSYVKIGKTGGAIMPVSVEIIESGISFTNGHPKWTRVSVAHFGEQNGDLMADPDMEFLYQEKDSEVKVIPLSIKNSYLGTFREAIFVDYDGTWKICKPEQHDQASFANQWMKNIKTQQGERIKKY